MTDQPECRPPAEFEDIKNHWLVFRGDTDSPRVWQWNNFMKDEWIKGFDDGYSTQSLASDGWTYLAPCRPDDAVERVRLQALFSRQKNARENRMTGKIPDTEILCRWLTKMLPLVDALGSEGISIEDQPDPWDIICEIMTDLGIEDDDWDVERALRLINGRDV